VTHHITVKLPFGRINPIKLAKVLTADGRKKILKAMGNRFLQITKTNFGPSGLHRPSAWAPLSPAYQKRIKYFGPPKLVLTRRMLLGLRQGGSGSDSTYVGTDVPYASYHQSDGMGKMYRPYFPIQKNGTLTAYAKREMIRAAIQTLRNLLR
jgi:hypothetical protein